MTSFQLGQKARQTRLFTTADLVVYRQLCGDAGLFFGVKENEVPGPLLGGMISDLLGTTLPGKGTNWLKQHFIFPRPAILDRPITAEVEIVRLRKEPDNQQFW